VGLVNPAKEMCFTISAISHRAAKEMKAEIRREIGMLFQAARCSIQKMSKRSDVSARRSFGYWHDPEKIERVNFCLKRVGSKT